MCDDKRAVPPCGIFCGACPIHLREGSPCPGVTHCRERKCKGIYVCCVEKKGLRFCHECKTFPCARFRKFAQTWLKYGQDLVQNQMELKTLGEERWLELRRERFQKDRK